MSSYEEQRRAKLARNLEVMQSLGLGLLASEEAEQDSEPPSSSGNKREKFIIPEDLRRRSSRVAELPTKPVYFKPPPVPQVVAPRELSTRVRKPVAHFIHEGREEEAQLSSEEEEAYSEEEDDEEEEEEEGRTGKEDDEEDNKLGKKVQCHLLDAELDEADIGHLFVPPRGVGAFKEYVITSLATPKHVKPVFNRYSGVQEFKNCLVLFANVRGRATAASTGNEAYKNVFVYEEEKGVVEMDWFAAPRTSDEVLARMTAGRVLLFLRVEGEAFFCAGPVQVTDHDGKRFRLQITSSLDHVLMVNPEFKARFMRLIRDE
ncbi:hypothetical protein BASA81_012708 [Batrachochytrium salamandrivorans]|nr:hypothetical protein BASA81_012708 [Batrachochytrium salamandrivorans]